MRVVECAHSALCVQELQKSSAVHNLSNLIEANRRHLIGANHGFRAHVNIETSMWIPKNHKVSREFLEIAENVFGAQMYCRQGGGYEEMVDWMLTKSATKQLSTHARTDMAQVLPQLVKKDQWLAVMRCLCI